MKAVFLKHENPTLFIPNISGEPEIVLIFPITRDVSRIPDKWKSVLDFVEKSDINTLVVIDKTEQSTASDYFMKNFEHTNKRLFVFPRSIKDTLFDTVGEITLDKNMWIIQLHDDDHWSGYLALPFNPDPHTVYYSDFYLYSELKGLTKFLDFSMPNRIVFSLVPSIIWNRFTELIQAQNYHVPGSFDFTFSLIARLMGKFEYIVGFIYEWKDDNWSSGKVSKRQLIGLAERDGWGFWSSPEIANFNRSVDSLVALNYLSNYVDRSSRNLEIAQSLKTFQPSTKKRIKHICLTILLNCRILIRKVFLAVFNGDIQSGRPERQLELYKFIIKTWSIRTLRDLISLLTELESTCKFEALQERFKFWISTLNLVERGTIGDK